MDTFETLHQQVVQLAPGLPGPLPVTPPYVNRAQQKFDHVLDMLQGFEGKNVLDCGAAPGGATWALKKRGAIVTSVTKPPQGAPTYRRDLVGDDSYYRDLRHSLPDFIDDRYFDAIVIDCQPFDSQNTYPENLHINYSTYLYIIKRYLRVHGSIIVKCGGREFPDFLLYFNKIRLLKPPTIGAENGEFYVFASEYYPGRDDSILSPLQRKFAEFARQIKRQQLNSMNAAIASGQRLGTAMVDMSIITPSYHNYVEISEMEMLPICRVMQRRNIIAVDGFSHFALAFCGAYLTAHRSSRALIHTDTLFECDYMTRVKRPFTPGCDAVDSQVGCYLASTDQTIQLTVPCCKCEYHTPDAETLFYICYDAEMTTREIERRVNCHSDCLFELPHSYRVLTMDTHTPVKPIYTCKNIRIYRKTVSNLCVAPRRSQILVSSDLDEKALGELQRVGVDVVNTGKPAPHPFCAGARRCLQAFVEERILSHGCAIVDVYGSKRFPHDKKYVKRPIITSADHQRSYGIDTPMCKCRSLFCTCEPFATFNHEHRGRIAYMLVDVVHFMPLRDLYKVAMASHNQICYVISHRMEGTRGVSMFGEYTWNKTAQQVHVTIGNGAKSAASSWGYKFSHPWPKWMNNFDSGKLEVTLDDGSIGILQVNYLTHAGTHVAWSIGVAPDARPDIVLPNTKIVDVHKWKGRGQIIGYKDYKLTVVNDFVQYKTDWSEESRVLSTKKVSVLLGEEFDIGARSQWGDTEEIVIRRHKIYSVVCIYKSNIGSEVPSDAIYADADIFVHCCSLQSAESAGQYINGAWLVGTLKAYAKEYNLPCQARFAVTYSNLAYLDKLSQEQRMGKCLHQQYHNWHWFIPLLTSLMIVFVPILLHHTHKTVRFMGHVISWHTYLILPAMIVLLLLAHTFYFAMRVRVTTRQLAIFTLGMFLFAVGWIFTLKPLVAFGAAADEDENNNKFTGGVQLIDGLFIYLSLCLAITLRQVYEERYGKDAMAKKAARTVYTKIKSVMIKTRCTDIVLPEVDPNWWYEYITDKPAKCEAVHKVNVQQCGPTIDMATHYYPHACHKAAERALIGRHIRVMPEWDTAYIEKMYDTVGDMMKEGLRTDVPRMDPYEWANNKRWPKNKRFVATRAVKRLRNLNKKHCRRKAFIKKEESMVEGGHIFKKDFKERFIQAATPEYNAVMGPMCAAFSVEIKRAWNGKDHVLHYACCNSRKLCDVVARHQARGLTSCMATDFSAFDSTEHNDILEIERRIIRHVMLDLNKNEEYALAMQNETEGIVTCHDDGVKIRYGGKGGRRRSGDADTSVGNTVVNAFSQLSALARIVGQEKLQWWIDTRKFVIHILGDDMFMQCTPEVARAYVAATKTDHFDKLGLKVTLDLIDGTLRDVVFLRRKFYSAQVNSPKDPPIMAVPLVGRCFQRAFAKYVGFPQFKAESAAHALAVCRGLICYYRGFPVIERTLQNIMRVAQLESADLSLEKHEEITRAVRKRHLHLAADETFETTTPLADRERASDQILSATGVAEFCEETGLSDKIIAELDAAGDKMTTHLVLLDHPWWIAQLRACL
jgi:23S rRNA U2552 (ribose-2'-O)-methylase RlmE/FtsJ